MRGTVEVTRRFVKFKIALLRCLLSALQQARNLRLRQRFESARSVESLIQNPARREKLGRSAQHRARSAFSAEAIVPRYEALYRRVCG